MDNDNTYMHILISTLTKKNLILDELINITKLQENYLKVVPQDMESFEVSLDAKEEIIDRLNQLDIGFESVYERVKEELQKKKDIYRDEILHLQELIRQVTDKSVKLQALEKHNKMQMEVYFSNKKQEIKNFKKSNQMASNYYKSMVDKHQGDSYFLDKKK